jgi:hypothetical protein
VVLNVVDLNRVLALCTCNEALLCSKRHCRALGSKCKYACDTHTHTHTHTHTPDTNSHTQTHKQTNTQVSGHDGGTGASPISSIKHAGGPMEMGLAEVRFG